MYGKVSQCIDFIVNLNRHSSIVSGTIQIRSFPISLKRIAQPVQKKLLFLDVFIHGSCNFSFPIFLFH